MTKFFYHNGLLYKAILYTNNKGEGGLCVTRWPSMVWSGTHWIAQRADYIDIGINETKDIDKLIKRWQFIHKYKINKNQ